jgi:hypothetical protein
MDVCCVFSGRGLCVGLIVRPEESYRIDREASTVRRPWPTRGSRAMGDGSVNCNWCF